MGEITSQVSSQDLRFPTLFWWYVPIWEVPTFASFLFGPQFLVAPSGLPGPLTLNSMYLLPLTARFSLSSRSFYSLLQVLLLFILVSFFLQNVSPGTAMSAMIVSFAFFFWITMSGLLWWISRSVWMEKSHNSFTPSFSSTLLGECSYHYFVIALKSIFLARLSMYDPPNNLFLYSISLSLEQLPKICCTVSSWLPHILHLNDTFSFTTFVLGAWSWAAKLNPSVSSFSSPVHIQFQETPDI